MIVRVRNLRVAVIFVRDAVVIVIAVLGVRLTVVIGIQLEVRLHLIGGLIRVRHRHRNIELLNGVLVQLRLIRELNGDLTGVLINRYFVALRSLEVSRNRELRTLRSLDVLTVLISERRGRLGLLTRNNQLALIRRLVLLAINRFELYEQVARVTGDLNSCTVTKLAVFLELQVVLVDVIETGNGYLVGARWNICKTKVLNNRGALGTTPGFTVVVGLELGSVFRRQSDNNVTHRLRKLLGRRVVTIRLDNTAVNLHAKRNALRHRSRVLLNRDGDVDVVLRAIRVSHHNRNSDRVTRLRIPRDGNRDLTSVLVDGHTTRSILARTEGRALRSRGVLTVLVLETRSRNLHVVTRLTRTVLVTRLELFVLLGRRSVRLFNRDGDVNGVLRAIRVSHNNRNSDLVTRLSTLRDANGDLTSVLVNLHTIRHVLTRGELRALRSLSVLTVLVGELRSIDLDIATRLTRTILVARLEVIVRVRNLRVAVIFVRDAVVIVIAVLGVRLTVVIGIQLEVRLHLIGGLIRVRHRHRNIELLNGVLVQLRLIRELNGDLTGVLINRYFVALRNLEAISDLELRTLRSLSRATVLASERRGRLGLLARNNQLVLIRRLVNVCVGVLVGHEDGPCGDIVSARDYDDVEDIALLCIRGDAEGARRNLSFNALGLIEIAGLDNLAVLIAPLNLRRQIRQVTFELRGHRGARGSRLVDCVVVRRDRHRAIRHERVVDVVNPVSRDIRGKNVRRRNR